MLPTLVLAAAIASIDPVPVQAPAPVTREELARAYLRFERLMHEHPPAEARRKELNQAFDAISLKFFAMQMASATHDLNELSLSFLPDDADKSSYRFAWSLATILEPADTRTTMPDAAIVLRGMYPVTSAEPITFWTEVRLAGAKLTSLTPRLEKVVLPAEGVWSMSLPLKDQQISGDAEVILSFSADELVEERRFLIPATDPASFASQYRHKFAELKDVKVDDPAYQRAKAICSERIGLLSGVHSSTRSAEFLLDAAAHRKQLYTDLKMLFSGVNPFAHRPGDIYRPIIPSVSTNSPVPCRVVVPAGYVAGQPVPLIVAFHGAGGDESMFIDAYGCGELKRLAAERNCILASPLASFTFAPQVFDAMIEQLAADYSIDRSRIYVVGHSMGSGVASNLARERAGVLAGVVCFAGGAFAAAPELAPTLVYAGALDPIVNPKQLVASAGRAKAAGAPVEVREIADCGHTLIVGYKLPEAVAWLLEHQLSPAPKR